MGHGSFHLVGGKHQQTKGTPPAWSRPTGASTRSWWEYIKGYGVFFSYIWPSKDRMLELFKETATVVDKEGAASCFPATVM